MGGTFQVALVVQNPPADARVLRDMGLIPGSGGSPGGGHGNHSSILAWRIAWTEEPRGLQLIGLQRVGQLKRFSTVEGEGIQFSSSDSLQMARHFLQPTSFLHSHSSPLPSLPLFFPTAPKPNLFLFLPNFQSKSCPSGFSYGSLDVAGGRGMEWGERPIRVRLGYLQGKLDFHIAKADLFLTHPLFTIVLQSKMKPLSLFWHLLRCFPRPFLVICTLVYFKPEKWQEVRGERTEPCYVYITLIITEIKFIRILIIC